MLRDHEVPALDRHQARHCDPWASAGVTWNGTKAGIRYLRVGVSDKTGERWLIARHRAVVALQRPNLRQRDISALSFETLFKTRVPHPLFRFNNDHQPRRLVDTCRKLMRDGGLLLDSQSQNRTMYSSRHTYDTLAVLESDLDIHTLSKQIRNSVAMIQRAHSKLNATVAADRLAVERVLPSPNSGAVVSFWKNYLQGIIVAIAKRLVSLSAAAFVTACGGGGDGPYNYAQHDGSYSCLSPGISSPQIYSMRFTEQSLTISFSAGSQSGTYIFDDKVGFIDGKPYYSDSALMTDKQMAQTFFFQSDKLVAAVGPVANVPDKVKSDPITGTCSKL